MSALETLAPDQRAVLELLLRRGRSYAALSELLGIPEETVRARAQAALENLAPDHAAPAGEAARIADWLLGQQDDDAAGDTRRLLGRSAAAREWAGAVAERLREVDAARVPEVPAAAAPGEPAAAPPAPRPRPRPVRDAAAAPPRPRPVRDAPAAPARDGAAEPPPPSGDGTAAVPAPAPRSSKLGGAILIAVAAILVAVLLMWLLGRGDDEPATGTPAQTATPSATPQVVNEIVLRATGGSQARGLMRVFRRQEDGRLVFALAAEKVPPNEGREVYAVWFTKNGGAPRRLGFAQTQVGREGVLSTGGPQQGDEAKLARWLVDYDTVLVTRERSADARRPGPAILRGTLPGGQ